MSMLMTDILIGNDIVRRGSTSVLVSGKSDRSWEENSGAHADRNVQVMRCILKAQVLHCVGGEGRHPSDSGSIDPSMGAKIIMSGKEWSGKVALMTVKKSSLPGTSV